MKANRFRPVLEAVREEGDIGIDACSRRGRAGPRGRVRPGRDLRDVGDAVPPRPAVRADGTHVNLDTYSALARWAATLDTARASACESIRKSSPATGRDPRLAYANGNFGFAPSAVPNAARFAAELGLEIDELHVHVGWGLQETARDALGNVYGRLATLAAMLPSVRTINTGGGCAGDSSGRAPAHAAIWSLLKRISRRSGEPSRVDRVPTRSPRPGC